MYRMESSANNKLFINYITCFKKKSIIYTHIDISDIYIDYVSSMTYVDMDNLIL